jgi:hypothetical protein
MDPSRVPFSTLCKILGISERRGKEWKRTGLFETEGAERCGELDAIKGAIVKVLLNELDRDDVDMVWHHVRDRLGDIVFGPRVDLACLITGRDAELCRTDEDLGKAISAGGSVTVIPLAPHIRTVRDRFAKEVAARKAKQMRTVGEPIKRSARRTIPK